MRRSVQRLLLAAVTWCSGGVGAQMPPACNVQSVVPVVPATAGFSVSPRDASRILFGRPVDGVSQVMLLDRTTRAETCLTCEAVAGGPAAHLHKGAPAFLADGERFVLQVEMATHPFRGRMGGPGAGWFNDLWLAGADGRQWWNLTNFPGGPTDRYGVLLPEPSPDGRQLAWAELYADDGEQARTALNRGKPLAGGAPWGRWRIRIAELATDAAGAPMLVDVRTLTVPGATWYETQAWSRDGRFLLFATDAPWPTPQAMDLWVHDFVTGRSTNLTRTSNAWEEFGDISPGGRYVAFMSSQCCDFEPRDDKRKLRSELYLTTPDRAHTARLTYFNERGHAHAKDGPGGSTVTKLRWTPDGARIFFERPFYGPFGGIRGAYLMELAFAGACGGLAADTAADMAASVRPEDTSGTATRTANVPTQSPRVIANASVQVGGTKRSYRLVLPPRRAATLQPYPVVVAFHGFGDNKDLMPLYSGLDDLAARHGAIVVYPQSRPGAWPLLVDWAQPDFAFFDALIARLDASYGIDRARVHAVGMSNGAYFVNLLAAHRADVIAAIATHSGGLGALAFGEVSIARRYPVLIVHGTRDLIVGVAEAQRALAWYRQRGHEVQYVELPGHGHAWARGKGINERIWSFFVAHPLR